MFDQRLFRVSDIKQIRRAVPGATFNDVVLTLCAGGLRRFLQSKNDLPVESLIAGCPINVRTEDESAIGGNRISAMIAAIHTEIADPIERLTAVTRSTRKSKAMVRALGPRRLMEINENIPAPALFIANKVMGLLPGGSSDRRFFNCPISNLPGPQKPLYLASAKLLNITCAMPVMDGYGLFLGALTYDGSLSIAMTSSEATLPHPEELGDCMVEAFVKLKRASRQSA